MSYTLSDNRAGKRRKLGQGSEINFNGFDPGTSRASPCTVNYQQAVHCYDYKDAEYYPQHIVGSDEITSRESDVVNHQGQAIELEEEVCFGMILDLKAYVRREAVPSLPNEFLVSIRTSKSFDFNVSGVCGTGQFSGSESDFINGLVEESSIRLQATCTPIRKSNTYSGRHDLPTVQQEGLCSLSIILYGPYDLAEDVGRYCGDADIFLQDPSGCDRNVRYWNPQKLFTHDLKNSQMTFDLAYTGNLPALEDYHRGEDAFESFLADEKLWEAEQPSALRTQLRSHQKKALTFMLRREKGWSMRDPPDLWEEEWTIYGKRFRNKVTDTFRYDSPPPFHGGILADPPGLGKSLTMLSLVSGDFSASGRIESRNISQAECQAHTTLIVVPPALMSNWVQEIHKHFGHYSIKLFQHHGQRRLSGSSEASDYHIVLTSYHTLAAEWRKDTGSKRPALFVTFWRRVILDEAHWIRNGASQIATAACNLQALSRWAVTGTPLQNRLTDLSTLLRFIRAYPYDQKDIFKTDIADELRSGNEQIATKRLRTLLRYIMLARPKTTIDLPQRQDAICPLAFSRSEQLKYDEYRHKALRSVDAALGAGLMHSESYFNVLQQINALRMICNLGVYHHTRDFNSGRNDSSFQVWNDEAAQECFNNMAAIGDVACLYCQMSVEALSDQVSSTLQKDDLQAHLSRCNQLICSSCFKSISRDSRNNKLCSHSPPCLTASISLNADTETLKSDIPTSLLPTQALPTKIAELLRQIKSNPNGTKSLVYSYWTSTLDIIAQALDRSGLSYVRFDGRVPLKSRHEAVNKLQNDPVTQIMLLTISCGGVGLTLTAASRAYLMEPHWNPTVEEQAFARIHRLGQEKAVTTVRFIMKDTIEEHVIQIQKSKNAIADLLLAPGDKSRAADNITRLEGLRSLL